MMNQQAITSDIETLARQIPNGAKIALFKECGVPMALGQALVRQQIRDLHIVTVPTGNMLPDILIGAGCVATIETAGVSLGEFGLAPRFVEAVKSGAIAIKDATCPAIYAGLQAAEKGIPFMPLRGLIGSDIVASRDDFRLINNPFAAADSNDPIVCLPAIQPDFALFHAPMADLHGNVYIERQAEMKIMAHAAKQTLVTVESIFDGNLLEDQRFAAGTLNALYVDGIAEVTGGAAPLNLPGHYDVDRDALRHYAQIAKSQAGFDGWLSAWLDGANTQAA